MKRKEFHKILNKPCHECTADETQLQVLWGESKYKTIFELTGLLFGNGTNPESKEDINYVHYYFPNLKDVVKHEWTTDSYFYDAAEEIEKQIKVDSLLKDFWLALQTFNKGKKVGANCKFKIPRTAFYIKDINGEFHNVSVKGPIDTMPEVVLVTNDANKEIVL
jgi:hypothetical protein